ncbi:CU044_5270 family protein [Streptomyces sp. MBT65]|uniref:CU044_5270 family protein n=1 Tax=Streptomyces sp. MBT65 TaxID=1488395 RepID=UPI001909D7A2|nr:CU044_5270 family protein [Streptomyces sp. MBT65]MBK3578166.1 CU044_5270 family protein [Streptomyces sp. MBT65]
MNQLPELPERDLPPGRHRLLKEHLMTEIRHEDAAPAQRRSKWLRPALTATAVATAAAVAFVVLPSSSGPNGSNGPAGPVGPGTSAHPSSRSAVALLEDIALAAEHEKSYGPVRDDQFVYVESKVSYAHDDGGANSTIDPLHRQEVWMSVDGLHTGLVRESGVGSHSVPPDVKPGKAGWDVSSFYNNVKTLPTDADAMYDYLAKSALKYGGQEQSQAMFVLVGDLLRNSIVPPAQSAALFRAAARIPGITTVEHVTDAVGRPGVAVARTDPDNPLRDEWIFDAKTYEFLGEREVATKDNAGAKKGTVTANTAVLRRAVVDRAGERP